MQTYILQAVTPLHVGDGAAIGAVKLPLTRERHTGWPVVPGSSIKGALRQRAGETLSELEADAIVRAFGPKPDAEDAGAGRVRFGPAQLLALPTRCLKGTFVLLTCPLALGRVARMVGGDDCPSALPSVPPGALAASPELEVGIDSKGLMDDSAVTGVVVLEEITLALRADPLVAAWAAWLGRWTDDGASLARLAVVHEDLFSHAVRYWTPARTRTRIGTDGTVADGQLFSVETLPPETLLFGQVDPAGFAAPLLPEDDELWQLGGQRSVGCGRVVWHRRSA